MKTLQLKQSKTIRILLGIALFFAVERLCHLATDGFSLSRIQSSFAYNAAFDPQKLNEEQREQLELMLDQPYHYLACGSQCFAFLSADKKYVLKFFKHDRFPRFGKKREKKLESMHDALTSCFFSYNSFQEETGMLYAHMTKTADLNCQAHLVDRLNIHHKINLDEYEFHIQKYAQTVPEYLLTLRKQGEHEKAKRAIDQLLDLSERRSLLGYNDKDPHFIHNFGFIEDTALQIDAAGFSQNKSKNSRRFYTKEIHKIEAKATPWIQKNYPEIFDYVRGQIKALYDDEDFFSQ